MTELVWDKTGDRFFQTGIDHGVLYLPNSVVPWNGLLSIDEDSTQEHTELFLDGVKYLHTRSLGNFSATLKAYTYPPEFEEVLGNVDSSVAGVRFHDQNPTSFDLSYRTTLGNDLEGVDYGYRVHFLYNLIAIPDTISYASVDASISPTEFSWQLRATPKFFSGRRPTSHVSIDSINVPPPALQSIEKLIYGSPDNAPILPPPIDLGAYLGMLVIEDNGDGTINFIDRYDQFISLDGDMYQIQVDTTNDTVDSHTIQTKTL